jgi:hypothetical protein
VGIWSSGASLTLKKRLCVLWLADLYFYFAAAALSVFQLSPEITDSHVFRGILSGLSKVETRQGKVTSKKHTAVVMEDNSRNATSSSVPKAENSTRGINKIIIRRLLRGIL